MHQVARASFGAFLGVMMLTAGHYYAAEPNSPLVLIVGSFGAQAVLLFAAPHAPLAQPWNCVAGNGVSAVIGVSMWKAVGDPNTGNQPAVAGALAVGLAVGVMLLCRASHPPGGATALIACLGPQRVWDLGYLYILFPAVLSSIAHVLLAVLYHRLTVGPGFYPLYWHPFGRIWSRKERKAVGKVLLDATLHGAEGDWRNRTGEMDGFDIEVEREQDPDDDSGREAAELHTSVV